MIARVDTAVANARDGSGSAVGREDRLDKSSARVRRMFASIAGRYDFLNHLFSLNIDRSWRTFTTRMAAPEPGAMILDCCTGTADLALAYDRASGGGSRIIATDFCREMLVLGREKVGKAKAGARITLIESDAQRLPLPSDTFGIVSVGFGLRNVGDTVRGIDELIRVIKPGGKLAILEFSRPRGAVLGRLYLTLFRHLLPKIGQAISPNADNAYEYLPRSVLAFPDGQAMLDLSGAGGIDRPETISTDERHRDAVRRDQARGPGLTRKQGHDSMNRGGSSQGSDLVVAMTGASGAPYAVRLLQVLSRFERTIHLTVSASAVQVLREELGLEISLDAFNPAFAGIAPERLVYHHFQDFNSSIASGSFPTAGMVIIPCSMSTLGCDRRGGDDQPDHARGGRASQGAAEADPGAARDTA